MHRVSIRISPPLIVAGLLVSTALAIGWLVSAPVAVSSYVPRDALLRRKDTYLYHAATAQRRGMVWFYGNDVAFWKPHQELAAMLTRDGYDVVGFDARRFFDDTRATGPERDSIVARTVLGLLSHARREFGDETRPVVLMGHSLGADLAVWSVTHDSIPHLGGILLLSPTPRSHLYATMRDRLFLGEPMEAGSYALTTVIRQLPPGVRVIVARGDHDSHDAGDADLVSTIVATGHAASADEAYMRIPLAGHSLRSLFIAGPMIARAVDRLMLSRRQSR